MGLNSASLSRLDELLPSAREVIQDFLELCHANGFNVQITSGFRTIEEQNDLYAKGRTVGGNKVTNAKGGESMHNYRIAIDTVILDSKGNADWNPVEYGKLWQLALKSGLNYKGLCWAGNWKGFNELVHFEVSSGKPWQEIAKLFPYSVKKLLA